MGIKTFEQLVAQHNVAKNNTSLDEALEHIIESETPRPPKANEIVLFDKAKLKNKVDNTFKHEFRRTLEKLLDEDPIKPLATINPSVFKKLDKLATQFPNFVEVIIVCKQRLTLFSLVYPALIDLPPILLSGPPGVGKTRFLRELACVLNTDFYALDFSTLSSSFVLNGGDSSWSESKPGFVSDSIRESRFANPIILLDEIDKVSDKKYNPINCLYGLFENHSAKVFRDEYLGIEMDVSNILWFATANYPESISAPIRSRMTEIHIAPPTVEQSKAIVRHVYAETLDAYPWGIKFSRRLSSDVVSLFAGIAPRLMKKEMEAAMARAAVRATPDKKLTLLPEDVNVTPISSPPKRGIGFHATF